MARMSERRQHVLNRIAAVIRNLEKLPEDFTLDKKLDRTIDRLEAVYAHHSKVINYRAVRKERADALQEKETQVEPAQEETQVEEPTGDKS